MYKAIVFFDLDGTLLDTQKNIQPSSLKAIQQLKHNHILPAISTGRNLSMIKDIIKKSGIDTAICDNGSYIQYNGKGISQSPIPSHVLSDLVSFANKNFGEPIAFQTNNRVVLDNQNSLTDIEYTRHQMSPKIDKNFFKTHRVLFANVFTLYHDKAYQKHFKNTLNIVRNSDVCLDVSDRGINKGVGIKIMQKKLNLTNVPTYAFGDGLNDLGMFKYATHGIAMGNGKDKDKQLADFTTTTNNGNGISRGLKHYHLI